MADHPTSTEVEAKFYLPHLLDVRQRLLTLGGRVRIPRMLERNTRYDTPQRDLTRAGRLLRLRSYDKATLTFKRRGERFEMREEIETVVADPAAAARLLTALGYQVLLVYEKYREVFLLDRAQVSLDELPFGCFVEIEAPTLDEVRASCEAIGFEWGDRVTTPYLRLVEHLQARLGESLTEATFDHFRSLRPIKPDDLGLRAAALQPPKAVREEK